MAGPFNLLEGFAHGPRFYALGNYFGLQPIDGGFGAAFSTPQLAVSIDDPSQMSIGCS